MKELDLEKITQEVCDGFNKFSNGVKLTPAKKETVRFAGEDVKLTQKGACDFCGEYRKIGVTHYGTSHYNRLICKNCIDRISDFEMSAFGHNLRK